jgi:ubiquinone/menaquinone biosynthesis C-methylase UbiE
MPGREVPKEFDQISAVYDATRDPLDGPTLDAIVDRLKAQTAATLLEVGVGTGRIAAPLGKRGLRVTGVDASRGMLGRAREKGIARLVRGSAYALPFRDAAFDAALFVHVLHLLEDPRAALREACRVTRTGAVALVRPSRGERRDPVEGSEDDPRRIVYDYLRKEGYPMPTGTGGPRAREAQLLREIPPDRLEVVSDREVTERVARRIDMLEQRASRHVLHVPPEVLRRAAAEARTRVGNRTVTYRRVEALATWTHVPPAPVTA